MTPDEVKKLDVLLDEYTYCDFELRRFRTAKAKAHAAIVAFVTEQQRSVPAGTEATDDIPAFLRSSPP